MMSTHMFGSWLDGSSMRLGEVLGELEDVSEETREYTDYVSRPTADGPIPRYSQDVMLYERLLLRALAEAQRSLQRAEQPTTSLKKK